MIEVVQDSKSRALTPKYNIIREPPDGKPEFLVIEINLPGIVSKDKELFISVEMTNNCDVMHYLGC